MDFLGLRSVGCHVDADHPGIFSSRKSHGGEMGIVRMRLWYATSLQEGDCFILGWALDPAPRPCACCVIAQVTSQDTPCSGLAQSVCSRPDTVRQAAALPQKPLLGSGAQSTSLCPAVFPRGSVHLVLSVPEGVLQIGFWGKERPDGPTHEGSRSE